MHEAKWLIASWWHVAAWILTKEIYATFFKVLTKQHLRARICHLIDTITEVLIGNHAVLVHIEFVEDLIKHCIIWLQTPML